MSWQFKLIRNRKPATICDEPLKLRFITYAMLFEAWKEADKEIPGYLL